MTARTERLALTGAGIVLSAAYLVITLLAPPATAVLGVIIAAYSLLAPGIACAVWLRLPAPWRYGAIIPLSLACGLLTSFVSVLAYHGDSLIPQQALAVTCLTALVIALRLPASRLAPSPMSPAAASADEKDTPL